jgi:NADPH:quinone reductase-like Zn-dependent oxidoreductase
MKAIYYDRYGSPDVLTLREVPTPVPKPNEVLVKVHAASINSWDWDMIRGEPWIVRMWGLTGPRHKIPGADIAGVVAQVGSSVTKFKIGDEVFGDLCECGWGGYSEFACAKENAVASKPKDISFEQAAALPQAGLMALQGIEKAGLVKGQKLLMNGAGGGVGTFVIQIAKTLGLEVTAVDTGVKLPALERLGADHVIDYRKTDFARDTHRYDVIIDVVANRSVFSYSRALNRYGQLIIVGGTMPVLFGTLIVGKMVSRNNGQRFGMLAYRVNDGLDKLIGMFRKGEVLPVIDSVFPLDRSADAFRHFASGTFLGKVLIKVA